MACGNCKPEGCGCKPKLAGVFMRRTAPRYGDRPYGVTYGALGGPGDTKYPPLTKSSHAKMFLRLKKVPGLPEKTVCVLSHWAGGVPEKAVGGSAGAELRKVWNDIKWHDFVWLGGHASIAAKAAGGAYEYAVTGGPKTIEHYCPGGPTVQTALAQLNALESGLAHELANRGAQHRKNLILNLEANVNQQRRKIIRKSANAVMDGASGAIRKITGFDTSSSQIALGVGIGVVALGLLYFIYRKT